MDYSYILENEMPFKIFVHRNNPKIIITDVIDDDCREIMRLIRELFILFIAEKKNNCFFHAACVANDEYAVAIIGDKFAGKTTMCINFLNCGWDFVSNDKLLLIKEKDIFCWGLPVSLGIREGTKQLFLKEFSELKVDPDDNRYYLTPNELIKKFNVSVTNGQKLKLMLIPVFSKETKELSFVKLSKVEARSFLKKQCLESIYTERKKLNKFVNCPHNDNFIKELDQIPIYRITVNKETNFQLKNIINEILKIEEN